MGQESSQPMIENYLRSIKGTGNECVHTIKEFETDINMQEFPKIAPWLSLLEISRPCDGSNRSAVSDAQKLNQKRSRLRSSPSVTDYDRRRRLNPASRADQRSDQGPKTQVAIKNTVIRITQDPNVEGQNLAARPWKVSLDIGEATVKCLDHPGTIRCGGIHVRAQYDL